MFAEILPTNVRSTAFPLGLSVMWLANFGLTHGFESMKEHGSMGEHGGLWLFAGLSVAGLVFISVMVPETRDKSPEEIARRFMGRPDVNEAVADAIRKQSNLLYFAMPDHLEPAANAKAAEQQFSSSVKSNIDNEKQV